MKLFVIARANIVRMLRDRTGLFFVFALPVIIIIVFGLAFGGSRTRSIGIVDLDGSPLSTELVAGIEANRGPLEIKRFETVEALRDAVQRNSLEIGIAVPAGYDDALRSGGTAEIESFIRPEVISSAVRPIVDRVIADQAGLVKAARYAAEQRGIAFEDALAEARRLRASAPGVSVRAESSGELLIEAGMNGYVMGAHSQLVMFMFLTSMTAATQLIVSRQLGVSRRMFGTPTRARTIIAGEALGRFGVAMIQGLFIFLGTAFVFGVTWGDPLATMAVIVTFALVATGVAMLVGAIATNPEQASSVGVGLAMLLAAFGGAMVPPEIFPDIMRTLSHVTPHSWAIDALRDVTLRDAGLGGILPELGVLLAFAAGFLALAAWRFRRAITG
jgi:ABC-2 type transport system permease protein